MRRLAAALVVTLAILLGPRLACAQRTPAADSLLDRMTGHWVLRGTIDGRATTHDVVAEWVLGREYVRLHEVARERSPTGAPAYEAIVYIGRDPVRPGWACLWLDSTGDTGLDPRTSAHADPAQGDSLAFLFRYGNGARFHTTFRYDRSHDQWLWHLDDETRDGKLQPFARVTLTRADKP